MYQELLPKIYEIKDLLSSSSIDDESSYFHLFESIISKSSLAKVFYERLEKELWQLDDDSWTCLKKDIISEITTYDKDRGWYQLFNRLNEVKGYIYLKSIGCTDIKFIPRSNTKTPDFKAVLNEQCVYCEVKTINISDKEIKEREKIKCRRLNDDLPNEFYKKLEKVIREAEQQILGFSKKTENSYIYLIINFDPPIFDYNEKFLVDVNKYITEIKIDAKITIIAHE